MLRVVVMCMEQVEGLIRHTRSMLTLTRKGTLNSSNSSSKDMVVVDMAGLTTRLDSPFDSLPTTKQRVLQS